MMEDLIDPAGAENIWRGELERGERKATTFDALWEAACAEAQARDWVRGGLIDAANEERVKAATLLLQYLVKKAA